MANKYRKAIRVVFMLLVLSLMALVSVSKYIVNGDREFLSFLKTLFFDDLATEYLGALISILVFYLFLYGIGKSLTDLINQKEESEITELSSQISLLKDSVKNDLALLTNRIDSIAHEIKVIQPQKIEEILDDSRKNTDFWFFNGGTGTYTKAVTLPKLSALASTSGKSIEIDLLIVNPLNESICRQYADYRSSMRREDRDSSEWDWTYVRNHSFATVLLCYALSSENKFLNISVGLKDHFSLFRFDISERKVLITKEDPKELAILFNRNSFNYDSYKVST